MLYAAFISVIEGLNLLLIGPNFMNLSQALSIRVTLNAIMISGTAIATVTPTSI